MQIDGNPLDVCSIAIYVALQTTLVPKTLPKTSAGVAATKEYTSFDVVGNIEDAIPIDFQRIPIVISVVQVWMKQCVDSKVVLMYWLVCVIGGEIVYFGCNASRRG